MRSYGGGVILRVSSSRVLTCRCGFQQVWMSVSRSSRCAGAGPLRLIGDQMFCAAIDASVTLASLDGVVRTVTTLCNWCSPLYTTLCLSVDVP